MSMSDADQVKCVCGHVRGIHSSDGTRPCHYGGLTPETQTCGCQQFIEADRIDEQVPTTALAKRADVAMFDAEPMPTTDEGRIKPTAVLLSVQPDPLGAVAAMCKMYEGTVIRDLSMITDEDRRHYWNEMKKTHLKAPLEAIDLHFMVEGVTRALTHQMVRQRTAVYAQESLRFAVKDNMAAESQVPPSISKGSPEELMWFQAMDEIETVYNGLIDMGIPGEDARGLLPHAVTTRLHYKTNLRNLLEHAGNRLCTQAQFEWRLVFAAIVQAIRDYEPPHYDIGGDTQWQFEFIADDQVFKPICYTLGHCQFNADFDRHCVIRDRVEEGRWDEINPAEWLANHAAARKAEGE